MRVWFLSNFFLVVILFSFFYLCHSKGHWGYYWKRSTCVLVPFFFIFSYFIVFGSWEGGFFVLGALFP